ncbi:MAG: nicotinate-nucleotide adenylyltransferase [Candidatus Aminicenantales bacterium]
MEKERIGILGGTFNPIHRGHLKAAEDVQRTFNLSKVLFIPSYIPPHKESVEMASPFHRLKMVELALADHPRFIPSSIEIEARGKSYSIVTLKRLKRLYPRTLIFFIMGVDAFLEIDTWKEYRKVLEQCFFIVVSRPGHRLEEAKKILGGKYSQRMAEISPPGKLEKDWLQKFRIFLFPTKSLSIASTEIRKRVREGKPIRGMVSTPVEDYIFANHLYREKND